ncbi:MAG: thymidylate kinase [Bryobacterales bacterium]|nr:thymidylate kinase [Bryobacterales bacterium]
MNTEELQPLDFYADPLPNIDVSALQGKLIVIEGPDSVGRTMQVELLRNWLEANGHAVVDTGLTRSTLTKEGLQDAKRGHTLGPLTMGLFYMADFADRLERVIVPALRAGFVVLTDRYFYSVVARSVARHQDSEWLERVAGFALVPHATFYLRASPEEVVARTARGRKYFEYWESGMDVPYGSNRYRSFVGYQSKLIEILDSLAERYDFTVIDANRPPDKIFADLCGRIGSLLDI